VIALLRPSPTEPGGDATASTQDLLAADHAQIRMLDHAVAEMKIMVAIGISANTRTLTVLQPLSGLVSDGNRLRYFGNGLIYLIQGEFKCASVSLAKGMTLNSTNPLNADMQKHVDEIGQLPQAMRNTGIAGGGVPGEIPARANFLTCAYTGHRIQ